MERSPGSRSAQECRDQAERLRGLAAKAKSPAVQWDYRELAAEWEMMADQIEKLRNERTRSTTMRQTEDPLSMAQRHVAEGEKRVEHQAILIAELDRAGRIELAVQARELLTAFETSLRLMREDLSRIENESRL
jgi:hypothetical protein